MTISIFYEFHYPQEIMFIRMNKKIVTPYTYLRTERTVYNLEELIPLGGVFGIGLFAVRFYWVITEE